MADEGNGGRIAQALVEQFERLHESRCDLVGNRIKGVEEHLERTDKRVTNVEVSFERARGALTLAIILIPTLTTIGVFLANHYGGK